MNSIFINEYINNFERILSAAYKYHYSLDTVERQISYSLYFQKIEKDGEDFSPLITSNLLLETIFSEIDIELEDLPVYNQCLWAAEVYLKIQGITNLTFEAIFIVLPIKKMYEYFDLYHEMDFSQIIDVFLDRYKKESILSRLIKEYGYSLKYISEETGISYDGICSLKSRRRDIKKLNVEKAVKLAYVFRVRVETIAEITME